MADLQLAAQVASIASAVFNAIRFGESVSDWLSRADLKKIEAQAVVLANTYSNSELESIRDRLEACRRRFEREGDGAQRVRCVCSVLHDARDGNGGSFPISEWKEAFSILGCD